MFQTVLFIGLGLIGGSIARKWKQVHPESRIMAFSDSAAPLEEAKADGVVDLILERLDERVSAADFILLCAPVSVNAGYLERLRGLLKPGALISDVGSTKTAIHEEASRLQLEEHFIGGHPMAGSERTGYACSRANLLENAYYMITPSAKSSAEQIRLMERFASDLDAVPMVLNYRDHDYAVAAVSHVPHLIAAGLVNLVKDSDTADQIMRRIAAGGFKDITRIASSSPEMWEQISMTNREQIIPLMERYVSSLQDMIAAMKNGNREEIGRTFIRSGAYRNAIPETGRGTLQPEYSLFCDIPDRPGAISVVAALLSYEEISIKNIGINHNRERQDGTLKIEFHDEKACARATECLTRHHFPVYPRK